MLARCQLSDIWTCRALFVCSNNICWIFWSRFVKPVTFQLTSQTFQATSSSTMWIQACVSPYMCRSGADLIELVWVFSACFTSVGLACNQINFGTVLETVKLAWSKDGCPQHQDLLFKYTCLSIWSSTCLSILWEKERCPQNITAGATVLIWQERTTVLMTGEEKIPHKDSAARTSVLIRWDPQDSAAMKSVLIRWDPAQGLFSWAAAKSLLTVWSSGTLLSFLNLLNSQLVQLQTGFLTTFAP